MEIIAKHRPFRTTGDDFATSNPMFAFYFYKYYISVIKPIYEDTPNGPDKDELGVEVKEAFGILSKLGVEAGVSQNDEANSQAILEYTELMFAKNDHIHQEGRFSKQIA